MTYPDGMIEEFSAKMSKAAAVDTWLLPGFSSPSFDAVDVAAAVARFEGACEAAAAFAEAGATRDVPADGLRVRAERSAALHEECLDAANDLAGAVSGSTGPAPRSGAVLGFDESYRAAMEAGTSLTVASETSPLADILLTALGIRRSLADPGARVTGAYADRRPGEAKSFRDAEDLLRAARLYRASAESAALLLAAVEAHGDGDSCLRRG